MTTASRGSSKRRVVVLGAGFAGLTIASELDSLAATGKADVTLVDRKIHFSVGFSMQWVLVGRRKPEDGQRPYTSLQARHVKFIHDEIVAIDTAEQAVHTRSKHLNYDYLVIALGAELAPELVPGLPRGGYDLHDMDSVIQLKTALEGIDSGTVAIVVTSVPFKCPPAPYEYAMLIDDMLRNRGVRENVRVVVSTPEPQPMPLAGKVVGDAIKSLLADRGIEYLPQHKSTSVDNIGHKIIYENGWELSYDVLGAVPPHRAPGVVRDAGLTNESGFVPVDLWSFETSVPNVYAVGDVASLRLPDGRPHPKAGAFAEAQASTLARNIVAQLAGGETARYSGIGVCFVDAGGDMAAAAEANLLADGGP